MVHFSAAGALNEMIGISAIRWFGISQSDDRHFCAEVKRWTVAARNVLREKPRMNKYSLSISWIYPRLLDSSSLVVADSICYAC
jgi:hypothetical protein